MLKEVEKKVVSQDSSDATLTPFSRPQQQVVQKPFASLADLIFSDIGTMQNLLSGSVATSTFEQRQGSVCATAAQDETHSVELRLRNALSMLGGQERRVVELFLSTVGNWDAIALGAGISRSAAQEILWAALYSLRIPSSSSSPALSNSPKLQLVHSSKGVEETEEAA